MRRRYPLLLLSLALMLLGCERVLSRPAEPRAYLDVPAEGERVTLPPNRTLTVVAHMIVADQAPSGWQLRWQGEGDVAHITGSLALPMEASGSFIYRGRMEAWPPEDLPPGTYRLWIEVQGADLPPSRPAWVTVLATEAFLDIVRPATALPSPSGNTPSPMPAHTPTATLGPTTPPTSPPMTPTSTPTASPTPLPCYRAQFLADVTLPDGTRVRAGTEATKIWRLRNTGSCTWPAETQVVQVAGPAVLLPGTTFTLGHPVPPGAEIDVQVRVRFPNTPGRVRADFRLRAPDGTAFGTGSQGDRPFWLDVIVEAPTPTPTIPPTPTYTPTPADQQGPDIASVQVSTQTLAPAPCGPDVVTIEALKVTDPSGVASVVVRWRMVDGSRTGPWTETPMQGQGGYYYATLDYNTVTSTLASPYNQAYLQIQVKATDTLGNTTYSAPRWVQVFDQCVQ